MSIIDKIVGFFKMIAPKEKREEKLELFNVSKYDRPGYSNYKKCPHCGVEANTNDEVKNIFGLMNVGGHVYFQSWCKECRNSKDSLDPSNDETQEKIDIP